MLTVGVRRRIDERLRASRAIDLALCLVQRLVCRDLSQLQSLASDGVDHGGIRSSSFLCGFEGGIRLFILQLRDLQCLLCCLELSTEPSDASLRGIHVGYDLL